MDVLATGATARGSERDLVGLTALFAVLFASCLRRTEALVKPLESPDLRFLVDAGLERVAASLDDADGRKVLGTRCAAVGGAGPRISMSLSLSGSESRGGAARDDPLLADGTDRRPDFAEFRGSDSERRRVLACSLSGSESSTISTSISSLLSSSMSMTRRVPWAILSDGRTPSVLESESVWSIVVVFRGSEVLEDALDVQAREEQDLSSRKMSSVPCVADVAGVRAVTQTLPSSAVGSSTDRVRIARQPNRPRF